MADPCKYCLNDGNVYCFACDNGNFYKPITQADRIRAMSDEEIAGTMCTGCPPGPTVREMMMPECTEDGGCFKCWLDWLQSPVGGAE